MRVQRFVLDTSAFTGLGEPKHRIEVHIEQLIGLIGKAKKASVSCYMPPTAWDELSGLLESKQIPRELVQKLDAWLVQKAPSRLELAVPAQFLYDYVGEVRERFNRGLREAEKAVEKTRHKPESHAIVVRELRDAYRVSMRKGLLDSREDLDVLLLAKELKAAVVATDEGIMKWAKAWGIRFIDARAFPRLLEEHTEE